MVDFAVPANHRVKLKENEKKDKYLDLTREWKNLRKMKVRVIPIVNSALSTVTKVLVQILKDLKIKEQVETIQTTALLRSDRILRRVLENWGDSLLLKLQWENRLTKRSNNNNNNNNKILMIILIKQLQLQVNILNSKVNIQLSYQIIYKQISLTDRWDPNGYNPVGWGQQNTPTALMQRVSPPQWVPRIWQ